MVDPIDLREFGRLEAQVEAQGSEIGELKTTIKNMAEKLDELPRETTVTARLRRHKYDAGWRGRVARWVAAHLLDAFDPDGKHI